MFNLNFHSILVELERGAYGVQLVVKSIQKNRCRIIVTVIQLKVFVAMIEMILYACKTTALLQRAVKFCE